MASQVGKKRKVGEAGFLQDNLITYYEGNVPVRTHYISERAAVDSQYQYDLPVSHTDRPSFLLLNDDCLMDIFKLLSLSDLSAVAETCTRLNSIASTMFSLTHKTFNLDLFWPDPLADVKYRRIFVNFGHLVTNLSINEREEYFEFDLDSNAILTKQQVFRYIIIYCPSIFTLRLVNFCINKAILPQLQIILGIVKEFTLLKCTLDSKTSGDLFSSCINLIKLEIRVLGNFALDLTPFENTSIIPKLESFTFVCYRDDIFEIKDMIINHKKLKQLNLERCFHAFKWLFIIIGEHLKELEIFNFSGPNLKKVNTRYLDSSLSHIAKLKHLKQLKLYCDGQSVSKFINNMLSVECIEQMELVRVKVNDALIKGFSKMKNLRVLTLSYMIDLSNEHLQGLDNLKHLSEFTIKGKCYIADSGVVSVVSKMPQLKLLTFMSSGFTFTPELYKEILTIRCNSKINVKLIVRNHEDSQLEIDGVTWRENQYVELQRKEESGDEDKLYPYLFDD